jgi:two-component system response regulator QseB
LGLPKLSGLKVLRQWRKDGCLLPILILTARDSVEDRVSGLDTGGDDYLVKPFDMDELLARLRALVRRKGDAGGAAATRHITRLKHQHLELDIPSHTLFMHGKVIAIPRREFILLQKLLENVGKVLSRAQLTQTLYGWDEDIDSNALEVHIHNLRKKLDVNFIRTIRGVGYMVDKI